MPHQRKLLTLLTNDFTITESKAYELLRKYPFRRVDLQIQAFEWRHTDIKNKAGFLINAIEQDYALPDKFHDKLKTIELEKDLAARQEQTEIFRKQQEGLIATCQICDDKGNRNIRLPENTDYKALRKCSHDPAIESAFEDWSCEIINWLN